MAENTQLINQADIASDTREFGMRDYVAEVEGATNNYMLSFQPETEDEKKILFKAMSNPDHKLADFINEEIKMAHFYLEVVRLIDEQTGEVTEAPRIVIIDEVGETYQAVSVGVFNSIKSLVRAFGTPETWDGKLFNVKVRQIKVARGSMLTLELN